MFPQQFRGRHHESVHAMFTAARHRHFALDSHLKFFFQPIECQFTYARGVAPTTLYEAAFWCD